MSPGRGCAQEHVAIDVGWGRRAGLRGSAAPGRSVGHVGAPPRPPRAGPAGLPHRALVPASQEIVHRQHDDAGGHCVREEPGGQPHSGRDTGQLGQCAVILLRVTGDGDVAQGVPGTDDEGQPDPGHNTRSSEMP